MNPRDQTRQNYDRLSRWYDQVASSEKRFRETGLQMLDVRAGETVLEIGFGTGHALRSIAQHVGSSGLAVGVELSPGMIAVARKRVQARDQERYARMIHGDGIFLPFAPASFEAVFISFTLELFSDAEISLVLNECRRILKPAGRLGVVSLAKDDTLACRLYRWGHSRWPLVLDCRPIHLSQSLEAGGFQVQNAKVERMWGLPVAMAVAIHQVRTLSP